MGNSSFLINSSDKPIIVNYDSGDTGDLCWTSWCAATRLSLLVMTAPLESGMSGHRGRVATDQSNKFVGIISRVLLSKRDSSVCSCNQSILE